MPLHRLVAEWDADLRGGDPLSFPGYGGAPEDESVRTGRTEHYAVIEGRFEVLGGSMGAVHGERVVRAFDRAVDERLPVVVLASSGGARMHEGMISLIQMPRTAAAAGRHARAGLLSLALYRSPTTGGAFASYANLVDIRAAVRGATVGFAGPRVVELTTGHRLPPASHTAESAFAAGLVDGLVAADEREQAEWVEEALGLRAGTAGSTPELPVPSPPAGSAWEGVQAARSGPTGVDAAAAALTSPFWFRAEAGMRGGLAFAGSRRVGVVAMDRHSGRPTPNSYRLAQRVARLAGRLGLPLVTFVDTPGADPGPDSEADGIAREIAATFAAFDELPTASVAVCVGEGGSGGALAVAHADRLLMLPHAVFSVIAPEGAAAILHRDASRAPDVAAYLRLTAADLLDLGVADDVVPGPRLRTGVEEALGRATPGDRLRRLDAATRRWVR